MTFKYRIRSLVRKLGVDVARARPDADFTFFLRTVCREKGINCVLDVGANVGQFGKALRASGYTDQLFSFEPVARCFARLQKRCAGDRRWTAFPYALGSIEGQMPINVVQDTRLSSFLAANDLGRQLYDEQIATIAEESVQVKRLDSVFDGLLSSVDEPKVLLKTDVQGWDLEVMKGAAGCIDRIEVVASECSLLSIYEGMTPMREFIPYMQTLGFDVAAFFPIRRDAQFRLVECDCVMVRNG